MLQRPVYAYDPASHYFVMAVSAQKIQIWKLDDIAPDSATGRVSHDGELETKGGALKAMTLCTDGGLVTVHETGVVVSWDLESILDGEPVVKWKSNTELLVSVVASHREARSGRHLMALGGEGGSIAMLELVKDEEPRLVQISNAHSDKVEVLVFSDDDERLATSARDRKIAIWSTDIQEKATDEGEELSLQRLRLLTGSGGWPLSLAFSTDHRKLVTGCMDNGVYLWDLEAEEALESVRFDHYGWVEDVAWADDDETILTASWDNAAGVYSTDPLAPQFHFKYHSDYVVRVLPIPGKSIIFAASYDGDVTVWDRQQGRLVAVLEGHGDWVTDLVWLGDGKVASLSSDRTARVWSTDDYSLDAVLGESLVQGFELQGGFDLASFGVGERNESEKPAHARRDLEDLQNQVVRRFDSSDSLMDEGTQQTAMAMLEAAVESADEVDAAIFAGESEESDPASAFGEDLDDGVGDELSDMVWEAISDVEDLEQNEPESSVELPGPEDLQARLDEDVDVSLSAESGEEAGATAESDGDVADLLDVPEMETASVADLGQSSGAETEDVAAAWADGEVESSSPSQEVDLNVEIPESEGFPSIEEVSEKALQAAQSDSEIDIMDSAFDPVPIQKKEEPKKEEPLETPEPVKASEPVNGEDPSNRVSDFSRGSAPTSGPLYDPKPLGPDDDIGELLPDDEELDLVFSGSISEVSEVSEVSETAKEEPGDVEEEPGDFEEISKAEEDPPGKADPSSARGAKDTAGGGEEKEETGTRLRDSNEVRTQQVDAQATARQDHERMEAIRKERSQHRHDPKTGERRVTKRLGESQKRTTHVGAPAVAVPEIDDEDEVDEDWGNSTQMWTGSSVADEDEAAIAGGAVTGRRLGDFKRREKTLGGRQAGSSLSARLKAKKKDLKKRFTVKEPTSSEPTSSEPTSSAGLAEATSGRAIPEDDVEAPAMHIQNVDLSEFTDQSEVVEVPSETEMADLVKVTLSELWKRATSEVPAMGILRRPLDKDAEYRPLVQFRTQHEGAIQLAVSPNERRLVTTGSEGTVEVWKPGGQREVRFKISDGEMVDVGYIEDNFLWGLDSEGDIHLWHLPKAGPGSTTIHYATIDGGETPFRCGWLVSKKRLLLTGGEDGLAKLWSLEKGHCVARLADHGRAITAVTLGRKGPITASEDGQVRFWNSRGLQVDQVDTSGVVTGLMASEGTVIWVEDTGALSMMQEGDNQPTRLKGHHGQGRSLHFRDDGFFISGGEDGRMLLYNGDGEDPSQEIQIPAPIHSLIMAERVLAAACEGGAVFVFNRKAAGR